MTCTILKNKFSAPFGIFYVRTETWKENFKKKNPIQPPNRELLICKLPFPNGSYHNGVCRALWDVDIQNSWEFYIQISELLWLSNLSNFDAFDILLSELSVQVSIRLFDWLISITFDHTSNLEKNDPPQIIFSHCKPLSIFNYFFNRHKRKAYSKTWFAMFVYSIHLKIVIPWNRLTG